LSASNAAEAISLSEKHLDLTIHMILTDMVMPGLNGRELVKKILEKRNGIRVLYMSGYTNDSLRDSGEAALQDFEFLQKPFGVSELLNKIKTILKA
jgi:DNA-binding NtrC family response regulator